MEDSVTNSKGKELATISVYLNTGIIAVLFGLGFIVSTVVFAGITLIAR